jgi:hypothetical protein
MKRYLIVTYLLLTSFCSIAQNQSEDIKVDAEYFKVLAKYDTSNIYIIADNGKLYYNYSSSYLGANDVNFKLEYTRQIRIKVNNLSSVQKKISLCTVNDSISLNDIRITKIVNYNLMDNKVEKAKINTKSIKIFRNGNDLMLDFDNLPLKDNCIIDIEFSIQNLTKTKHDWNFQHPYYTIASTLEMSVPEIYVYSYEESDSINFKIDHSYSMSQGVFLGYYLPNTNLHYKLVTPTYYKIMKEKKREEEIEGAKKIYCKYTNHSFRIQNLSSNINAINSKASIRFKVLIVNPIIF